MPTPTNHAVMLSSVSFAGTTCLSQWSKYSARGVSVARIRTMPAANWKMRRATDLRIAGREHSSQICGMRADGELPVGAPVGIEVASQVLRNQTQRNPCRKSETVGYLSRPRSRQDSAVRQGIFFEELLRCAASNGELCTTQKHSPLTVRHRRWLPPRSRGAIQPRQMCRLRFCSAAFVILTCIRCAMSGAA